MDSLRINPFLGMFDDPIHAAACAMICHSTRVLSVDSLRSAIERINRETAIGPLLNPSVYVDGRRFNNAREYCDVLEAILRLRTLVKDPAENTQPAG